MKVLDFGAYLTFVLSMGLCKKVCPKYSKIHLYNTF
jgi:hypothetical protein